MSTENIMTTSHWRILKQQRDVNQEYHDDKSFKNIETTKRGHSRKHSDRLSKQWVVQESTQMSYWNNELFKEALRWAIEIMKMSKPRISSNNKRGVVWGSTQIGYWNDKRHCQKTATVRSMKVKCQAHNLMKYDLYWNNCFNSYYLTRMQSLHQQHNFCVSWLSSVMWHSKFQC